MDSLIRWTKRDRQRLDSAIKSFNKEVNKLSKTGIDVPEKKKFSEVIPRITTREEFANVLDSLLTYNEITATQKVELTSGEKVSLYDYNETSKRVEQGISNLNVELKKLYESRAITRNSYMGFEREDEIRETLDVISQYNVSANDFKKASKRVGYIGRKDYEFAKNKLFRDNFMKSLENVQNFQHYNILKQQLNKYRNPTKFYEYVKKSNIMMDIFLWYNSNDGYTTYGSFNSNDEMFDYALTNELGIKIE